MLGQTSERRTAADRETIGSVLERTAASEATSPVRSTPFRLARLLYGGVVAFMAIDNFRNQEERVGYADAKDAPNPAVTVPAISGALLGGGLGIALWRLPRLAALGAAAFFLSVTPVMHDFWNHEGEERTQQQIHFLKNTALLGAALAFLGVANRSE